MRPFAVPVPLACPVSHQPLQSAPEALIAQVNAHIRERSQRDVTGSLVLEPLEGGLLRADGRLLYPVRRGVAVLLETAGLLTGQ